MFKESGIDPEDIAQHALFRTFTGLERWRSKRANYKFVTFSNAVLRNAGRDLIRHETALKRGGENKRVELREDHAAPRDERDDGYLEASRPRLSAAIATLSCQERDVVFLRLIGTPYAAIATALSIGEQYARVVYKRAKGKLMEYFGVLTADDAKIPPPDPNYHSHTLPPAPVVESPPPPPPPDPTYHRHVPPSRPGLARRKARTTG